MGHVTPDGRKDPLLAAVLSFFVPGLGQVYNGRAGRGCIVLAGTIVGFLLLLVPGLCVWGYGIYDGYCSAKRTNLGDLPFRPAQPIHMAAFVAVPVLIVAAALFAGGGSVEPPPPPSFNGCTNALTVPYDDLFRYNERYVGKTIYIRGMIDQAVENPIIKDNYVFRVSTKEDQYFDYMGDIVWVEYTGPRYLEGDVIGVCGQVTGLKEYTAVLGNPVTVPEIRAIQVDLLQKSGDVTPGELRIT